MAAVGRLQTFDETSEDVENYFERVDAFFLANGIEENAKVATLITVLGPKAYDELRTALQPTPPLDSTYEECKGALVTRYRRPNISLAERMRLSRRRQAAGESISEFAAGLRQIVRSCGFAGAQAAVQTEAALLQAFVENIRDISIKKELMRVDNLTFSAAITLAQKLELVNTQVEQSSGHHPRNMESLEARVCAMNLRSGDKLCWRCGYSTHESDVCRARKWMCYACGKVGHVAAMCESGSRSSATTNRVNYQDTTQHRGSYSDHRLPERRDDSRTRVDRRDDSRYYGYESRGRRPPDQADVERAAYTSRRPGRQQAYSDRREERDEARERGREMRGYRSREGQQDLKDTRGRTADRGDQSKVKFKRKVNKNKCNLVDEVSESELESEGSASSGDPINLNMPENFCRMLGRVGQQKAKYSVVANINNHNIEMAIDTCSDLSLITLEDYKSKFSNIQLLKTKQKVKTYGGQPLKLIGKILVNPIVDGKSYSDLTIYIADVSINQPPLLGCDWLQHVQINWSRFKHSNDSNKVHACINNNDEVAHNQVVDLIKCKYPELISKGMGLIKNYEANINLKEGSSPVFRKAYPVPLALRPAVERELEKQVDMGILVPVRYSPWATPIVVVPKKNCEEVRLCGDYKRTLNPLTETEQYPLPSFEDMSINWVGSKFFSVIDLKGAYLQIKVSEASSKMLTINTHKGLYRYTRMVYGWCGAPAEFQRVVDQIISGIPGCSAYLDDICVAGATKQEAKARLVQVLDSLSQHGVKLNLEKCQFLQQQVEYVGHNLSGAGILPTSSKFAAVREMKPPTTKEELTKFLGLLNYYSSHIPNLSTLTRPLYDLSNQGLDSFTFNHEQSAAFISCKEAFLASHALMPFDCNKPIVICTDASPVGTAGVLYHVDEQGKERPVFFTSRSLTPTQQKYPQVEREGLAIVHSFQKFHKFIYGKEFTLFSDNKPIVYIFAENKQIPITANQRIQRWALMLSAYKYRLRHRKGSEMLFADFLSRNPLPEMDTEEKLDVDGNQTNFLQANIRQILPLNYSHIAAETKIDPVLIKVHDYVLNGWPEKISDPHLKLYFSRRFDLTLQDDCILYGDRVIIPGRHQYSVLELLHQDHPGETRMKMLARSCVWWPSLENDIISHVQSCKPCQATRNNLPENHSHWPVCTERMERLHADFAYFKGINYLVIFDAFSKWIEIFQVPNLNFNTTVKAFNQFFSTHGFCRVLNTDNGAPFNSASFAQYCRERGINHVLSPPWHPKSNGAGEKAVQTFKKFMKKTHAEHSNLPLQEMQNKIIQFLFSYRNTPSTVTGKTPAQLFLNCSPLTLLSQLKPSITSKNISSPQSVPTTKSFHPNEKVYVKTFLNAEVNWIEGKILSKISPFIYRVLVNNVIRICHTEQLRSMIVHRKEAADWRGQHSGTQSKTKQILGSPRVAFPTPEKVKTSRNNRRHEEEIQVPPVNDNQVVLEEHQVPPLNGNQENLEEPQNINQGDPVVTPPDVSMIPVPTIQTTGILNPTRAPSVSLRRSKREIHKPRRLDL